MLKASEAAKSNKQNSSNSLFHSLTTDTVWQDNHDPIDRWSGCFFVFFSTSSHSDPPWDAGMLEHFARTDPSVKASKQNSWFPYQKYSFPVSRLNQGAFEPLFM